MAKYLRDTFHNKGARAKRLKWADFALATSPHVLANVSTSPVSPSRLLIFDSIIELLMIRTLIFR